jgi:hypothetical protein
MIYSTVKAKAKVAMARYRPRSLKQGKAIIIPQRAAMHPARGREIQKGNPNLRVRRVEA